MRLFIHLMAIAAGIGFGVYMGAGYVGLAIFGALAFLGSLPAWSLPRGAERMYWLFVVVTLGLWVCALFFFDISATVMIAPLVIVVGYFTARLLGRFTGQRKHLPSRN